MFSGVWLHSKNAIFLLFLTFFHPFSQVPNNFYNRKFLYINLKQTKSKQNQTKIRTKHFHNSKTLSNGEKEEERVIDK